VPDKETMICYCHNLTIAQIADYIKASQTDNVTQIVEDQNFACGNSCQSCHEEGYNNDGFSLAMVLGMVKKGYI